MKKPTIASEFRARLKTLWFVVKYCIALFLAVWAWQIYRVFDLWLHPLAQRDLGHGVKVEVWKDRHRFDLFPIIGWLSCMPDQSLTARFSFGEGVIIERSYDVLWDIQLEDLHAEETATEKSVYLGASELRGVSILKRQGGTP